MTETNTDNIKHGKILQSLHQDQVKNDKRLSRPLNLFTSSLVNLNIGIALLRGPQPTECNSQQTVEKSNQAFESTFPKTLCQLLQEINKDPAGYRKKVQQYEKQNANRPEIPFDTEDEAYNLIIKDPLRIKEEHFLYKSLLEHDNLLNRKNISCLDLGTGSGRLVFCMSDILSRFYEQDKYKIYGLDINHGNLLDACNKKKSKKYGNLEFINGDMINLPFQDSSFSLCNISTASYLIPYYERPFLLLEMCRILDTGGEGIITGINPKFSLEEYAKCMAASNLFTYFNPLNLYRVQQASPIGVLISQMCQKRKDFTPTDTEDLSSALRFLGCEIKKVETWPQNKTVKDFYTGVHFKVTPESKKLLNYGSLG